jgi:hypothetical protein
MPSPQGVNTAIASVAAGPPPARRLVVATLAAADPALLLPPVAQRLAALTGVPLVSIPAPGHPPQALAALAALGGGWLAPLPLDVGLSLEQGSWAEALGAWRQPTLLVWAAPQLATGLPAAATALMERWAVPLVGLLQWGGDWEGRGRRQDGLPWLGRLAEQPQADNGGEEEALLAALERRWRQRLALLA